MNDHRWWHAGGGYKHAFCLFCGAQYLEYLATVPVWGDRPCPEPRASGGEEEAQRILTRARSVPLGLDNDAPRC